MRRSGAVALALSVFLAGACPAYAADLLRKDVVVGSAVERSCTASKLSGGSGYIQETVTMPVCGSVVANLMGRLGRLGRRDLRGRRRPVVAGSSPTRGAREVAEGFARGRPAPDRPGLPAAPAAPRAPA